MMLSASPFHTPIFYTPMPSPLADRSPNVLPRTFPFPMASSQPSSNKPPIPKRAYKLNPAVQTREAQNQRRRDLFFRKVRHGREERKWDARGEQLERLDFLSDQKRWEAAKARQAPTDLDALDEQLLDELAAVSRDPERVPEREQELEAEWVLAQEDRELQELIAGIEEQGQDGAEQGYGSDEEEYDDIFMECANKVDFAQYGQSTHAQQSQSANAEFDCDAMDMTDG